MCLDLQTGSTTGPTYTMSAEIYKWSGFEPYRLTKQVAIYHDFTLIVHSYKTHPDITSR